MKNLILKINSNEDINKVANWLYKNEKKAIKTLQNLGSKILNKYKEHLVLDECWVSVDFYGGYSDTIRDWDVLFHLKKTDEQLSLKFDAIVDGFSIDDLKEAKQPYFKALEEVIKNKTG